MKLAIASLLLLGSFPGTALADRVITPERGDSVNEDVDDVVVLRPHNDMIRPLVPNNEPFSGAVNTHTIFVNKCTGGCTVKSGTDSSVNNTSSIVHGSHVLQAYPYDDASWQKVMSCVKASFGPFNVTVTDVDPSPNAHLEIMTGHLPAELGFSSGTGGVAPFPCQAFVPNALVFAFAGIWGSGTTCDDQCVTNICATVAQEIAHSWALDHVIDATDPMTYYGQNVVAQRRYKNAELQCGSDCVSGTGPNNETCTGANKQNHACSCTGANTQNDFETITNLFGAATPTPPVVAIMDPKDGATVQAGFPIHATATDTDGIDHVVLKVDGTQVSMVTTAPYAFNAPATLGDGTHHVEIDAFDIYGASASAAIDVIIGHGCDDSNPCTDGNVCVGGKCVAGQGTPGGLGTACTDSSMCTSGICASGNAGMVCATTCSTGQCPSGFGCAVPDGTMQGVCYPGFDDGSGGGGCAAGNGSLGMGLALGALLVTRRRRRA